MFLVTIILTGCRQKTEQATTPVIQPPQSVQIVASGTTINLNSGDIVGPHDSLKITWPKDFTFEVYHGNFQQLSWYFKTYISSDLKIGFSISAYMNYPGGNPTDRYTILVRSWSTIYTNSTYDPTMSVEWITAFQKSSGESLAQAIQRMFITGKKDCYLETGDAVTFSDIISTNGYEAYGINHHLSGACEDWMCLPNQYCGDFAMGDYIWFFVGNDQKDTFYFINAGQDPLPWLNGKPRYTSLQFLE